MRKYIVTHIDSKLKTRILGVFRNRKEAELLALALADRNILAKIS